jgi:hypothetical protein
MVSRPPKYFKKPTSPVNGPRTDRERSVDGPLTENRISYLISFLLLLLIFLIISALKFNQVLDVMLQTHSSPRREAASPPSPPQLQSKEAVTLRALMLHFGTCSYRDNPSSVSSGAAVKSFAVLGRRYRIGGSGSFPSFEEVGRFPRSRKWVVSLVRGSGSFPSFEEVGRFPRSRTWRVMSSVRQLFSCLSFRGGFWTLFWTILGHDLLLYRRFLTAGGVFRTCYQLFISAAFGTRFIE